MGADKLAGIAEEHLGMLEDSSAEEPVVQDDEASVNDESGTEEKPPAGRAEATPDVNTVLAQLRERIERGELKVEDIPQELLPADARKVQSSFARKFAGLEKGAKRVEESLRAAGVTLPPGKTFLDLMSEDGGKGFDSYFDQKLKTALAPVNQALDVEDFTKKVNGALKVTVGEHPDLEALLPEIGKAIEGNEQLGAWAANVEAIPYIVLGVGRDIQYQKAAKELGAAKAEVQRLTGILKKANIAINNGPSSSKAGGKTPSSANDESGVRIKGLENVANAMWDKLKQSSGRAN